jgi:hypothetical protein
MEEDDILIGEARKVAGLYLKTTFSLETGRL